MMAKTCFSSASCSIALLFWFPFVTVVLADYYDNQLLGVNATWPSGAKLIVQDCCDGNSSNPSSLDPFREGPPTVYLKANHDDETYPESYIEATNKTLLSSKYLAMLSIYNETDGDTTSEFLWIQFNMTASTPGGIVSDNNTFVTLNNETEPFLSYDAGYDLSTTVGNLSFDQVTWQLSLDVYEQTPELENYLYTKFEDDRDPKQNDTLLYLRIVEMFLGVDYGSSNPSRLWNSTSLSPWGRVYCDAPGVFDADLAATPTASTTGGTSGASSTSSSHPSATKNAAIRKTIYGGSVKEIIFLFPWLIAAVLAGLFI